MRMRRPLLLPALFLLLALPLGLMMLFEVPLGQVADEPAHVLKADSLLRGQWIGRREISPGPDGRPHAHEGVDADRALLGAIVSLPHPLDTTPTRIDPAAMERSRHVPFGNVAFSETGTIASYFPVFYIPAAIGIGSAQWLDTGTRTAFLCARILNLLLCLGFGAAALALARRGRAVLFAVLLLPTTIGLMASVNQDGLLIASAVLAAALATRMRPTPAPWRQPAFLCAAALVACICLAKPPYLPMGALLLLPFSANTRQAPGAIGRVWLQRAATLALILLGVLLWTALNVRHAAAPVFYGAAEAGPLWPGPRPAVFDGTDMGAQMRVLLAKPWRVVTLPLWSMITHPAIFRQMVDAMGWLNLMLPPVLVGLWAVALAVALLAPVGYGATNPSSLERALLLLSVFATVLLIYISQYLSFTPVGWNWISGPQGRYLLPLLPMIALALDERSRPGALPMVPAAIAAIASLWMVPHCVQLFYHAP